METALRQQIQWTEIRPTHQIYIVYCWCLRPQNYLESLVFCVYKMTAEARQWTDVCSFKCSHHMSGVVVFKYLVFCWKAGTSHVLLERETAPQGSITSSKSSFGPQLSIPPTQTELYLQLTSLRPTFLCVVWYFFCLVCGSIYFWHLFFNLKWFLWSWEDIETKSSNRARHKSYSVLSKLAAVIFGSGWWQSPFSSQSLAKAQWPCYIQRSYL